MGTHRGRGSLGRRDRGRRPRGFLGALRDGSTTFRLPEGESPLALKTGEFVSVLCPDVFLREPRRVTQGVYGGPRVRLAKNLAFNLGAFRAAPTTSCTTSTAAHSSSPASATRSWTPPSLSFGRAPPQRGNVTHPRRQTSTTLAVREPRSRVAW
ncbi:MAG: hypothetical protein WCP98_17970 [Actinomycetes bacterium]